MGLLVGESASFRRRRGLGRFSRSAFKELPPKEVVAARLDETKKLKDIIDEMFRHVAESLEAARRKGDTDASWNRLSKTTEQAYHRADELSEKKKTPRRTLVEAPLSLIGGCPKPGPRGTTEYATSGRTLREGVFDKR